MNILFLTVSDRAFFPGTLAAINSLLENLDLKRSSFQIAVVDNGEFGTPMSEPQLNLLQSCPNVITFPHEHFQKEGRVLGGWQLKSYAAHDLFHGLKGFDVLVGFDSDLFFCSDIQDVAEACMRDGKMRGGKDGGDLSYGDEYKVYDEDAFPSKTDRYMSTSCYFVPRTPKTLRILRDWAEKTDEAVYGPQETKKFPGHGDQGVLNAIIHQHTKHEIVDNLENRLWSQHWTFEDDILYVDGGALLNASLPGHPKMRTVHCGGSHKFWTVDHSKKRMTPAGSGQKWAYALWLKHLFLGEIKMGGVDPLALLPPGTHHLLVDLVRHYPLIRTVTPRFHSLWEKLHHSTISRIVEHTGQHRMMTLCGNGSMDEYIRLAKTLPKWGNVVEVGSYLGGSTLTLAVATLGKDLQIYSIESFMGNLDGTVDGHPLPNYNDYCFNLKVKFPELNINHIPLPSQLAHSLFPDGSLDLIFIDASHDYDSVIRDIKLWKPKLSKGGIMAGDDFSWSGVNRAVKESFPSFICNSEVWSYKNP